MSIDMVTCSITTTLATKGQVILPKAILDHLQWESGARLAVEHTADGVLLKRLTSDFAPTLPAEVFGCLSYNGKPKTVEQMNAGIAAEAKRRHACGRY
jgi:AbrB family looped-hinge helix DNA binding protein